MKRLLVTFDAEEIDWGAALAAGGDSTGPSAEGIGRILPVLGRVPIRATFFCTAHFAQRQPGRVRAIVEQGHEVASHGWVHGDDYGRMAPERALTRLRDSRRLLEDVTGREVLGVRTPRLSACPAGILTGAGFVYDASPQPAWLRAGVRAFAMPRQPFEEGGLLRVPLSVVPVLGLPVSWYVFRAAGAGVTGALARLSRVGVPYVHLYFHPWEAADLDRDHARHPLAWRTGEAWLRSFERLVSKLAESCVSASLAEFVATRRAV